MLSEHIAVRASVKKKYLERNYWAPRALVGRMEAKPTFQVPESKHVGQGLCSRFPRDNTSMILGVDIISSRPSLYLRICAFSISCIQVFSQNLAGRGWDATDGNGELVTPDANRVRHAEKDRTSKRRSSVGPKTLGKRKAVIEGLSRTMLSNRLLTSLPSWTHVGFHSDKQVFSLRSESGLEVVAPYRDASNLPKKILNRNSPTPDTSDASSSCQASVPRSWRDHYYTYMSVSSRPVRHVHGLADSVQRHRRTPSGIDS